jgi:hypothetical protein
MRTLEQVNTVETPTTYEQFLYKFSTLTGHLQTNENFITGIIQTQDSEKIILEQISKMFTKPSDCTRETVRNLENLILDINRFIVFISLKTPFHQYPTNRYSSLRVFSKYLININFGTTGQTQINYMFNLLNKIMEAINLKKREVEMLLKLKTSLEDERLIGDSSLTEQHKNEIQNNTISYLNLLLKEGKIQTSGKEDFARIFEFTADYIRIESIRRNLRMPADETIFLVLNTFREWCSQNIDLNLTTPEIRKMISKTEASPNVEILPPPQRGSTPTNSEITKIPRSTEISKNEGGNRNYALVNKLEINLLNIDIDFKLLNLDNIRSIFNKLWNSLRNS